VRPLEELLSDEPAWPLVESWLAEATNEVEVLPAERARGEDVLHRLQVTSHSTLGAVALETGGILVDGGWLRLLGSGSPRLRASLASWNKIGDAPEIEPLEWAMIVGFDAVGGFFAFNGGDLPGARGEICYFAPDTLAWEPLELGYTAFVDWTFTADLEGFYAELRWPGWEDELAGASGDVGFSLYPPPFVKEGRPISNAVRKLVPMRELWQANQDFARQVADLPDGTRFRFRVED
jgi:hypothetical protein